MDARVRLTTCNHLLIHRLLWVNWKSKSWGDSESLVCDISRLIVIIQTKIALVCCHICSNPTIFLSVRVKTQTWTRAGVLPETANVTSDFMLKAGSLLFPCSRRWVMLYGCEHNFFCFPFHILRCSSLPSWQLFSPPSSTAPASSPIISLSALRSICACFHKRSRFM